MNKNSNDNKITLKATAVETPDKDTGRTGVHDWATELEAYAQARTAFEKYKVTDIDFQVDDDEDQPDISVREHVLAQEFWEAEAVSDDVEELDACFDMMMQNISKYGSLSDRPLSSPYDMVVSFDNWGGNRFSSDYASGGIVDGEI